jgi:alkanesulfonate monooxygenase SsuD/methylene tetrahydromethanopterin reductase-like flavin-dependent oxidoreductase (luciferase family)
MKIGIGLPNPMSSTTGRTILDWARRAEDRGFASLATIDRIAYPSFESLITLSAAAAVTERIGLRTNVLVGPTRDSVLLAKQAASVDQLSGGRLVLGLSSGDRPDDFAVAGQVWADRGRRFDEQLDLLHRAWAGEPVAGSPRSVSPRPVNGRVPILIGGASRSAARRTAEWGVGWTAGGVQRLAEWLPRITQAWRAAGRVGRPTVVAHAYFALGPNGHERAGAYLADYYAYIGPEAERIVDSIPRDREALLTLIRACEGAGADELIFSPTISDLAQVDLLADAVLGDTDG